MSSNDYILGECHLFPTEIACVNYYYFFSSHTIKINCNYRIRWCNSRIRKPRRFLQIRNPLTFAAEYQRSLAGTFNAKGAILQNCRKIQDFHPAIDCWSSPICSGGRYAIRPKY
ncbi:hypothetical protein CHS0354_030297 [Potamilus streckersoni]|uniref:Uncharacterized protein n=1 Tax=Potamilus streckersoni TaxID=2493646 RepID=A0AAE0T492_9BIVA|nr:hypothetical protein CHS0354_030297 [Potamilus streckersoni]